MFVSIDIENPKIQLIDFGSAVYIRHATNGSKNVQQPYSNTVSTRHYRAPEILLRCGWGKEIDIWSIGCLLIELRSGIVLFQTHDE